MADAETISRPAAAWWVPLATAAAVVLVTGGLATVVALHRGDGGGLLLRPPGIDAAVVRDGDRVSATGTLVWRLGQPPRLCQVVPPPDVYPLPAPVCSAWAVVLSEPAVPASVAWQHTSGVRHADRLYTVNGIWRNGRIEQQSVVPAGAVRGVALGGSGPRQLSRFPMPCRPPDGGWRRGAPTEADGAALDREIAAHPERYSGVWRVVGPAQVTVVGTVEDPATVRPDLARLFGHNLCVMRVDYPMAQLGPLASRLATRDGTWRCDVFPDVARVYVQLLVLDESARARIGDDADKVIVRPFIRHQ